MFKRAHINMLDGPIAKNLLLFALPVMFSGILQLLYNAADIIVVGKFAGAASLAAVGSTSYLINLIINIAMGIAVGVNVIIARHLGANDAKRAHKALHTAATIGVLLGIFTMLFGLAISRPALEIMDTPSDVIDKASLYLKIYFLGVPALIIYNFGSSALRSVGDTTRPLIFLTVSGLVNVSLNLVFVIYLKMDVAGVALATIISQYLSAVLVTAALYKGQGVLIFRFGDMCFDKREFLEILKIGIPAGLQGATFSLSNVIIQSAVNSFDNSFIIAGNTAASNIEGFVYTIMNSFYSACVTFVSQNLGAKKLDRIPKIIWRALFLQTVFWMLTASIVLTFDTQLLGFYADEAGAIEAGQKKLLVVAGTYILCGFLEISTAALRGIGRSLSAMLISIFGICGIRIIWVYTVFKVSPSLEVLFISYPVSWFPVFVANFIYFAYVFKKLKS